MTPENQARVIRAFERVQNYGEEGDSTDAALVFQWLGDLVCDMRHLCDWYYLSWADVQRRAEMHYKAEADSRG